MDKIPSQETPISIVFKTILLGYIVYLFGIFVTLFSIGKAVCMNIWNIIIFILLALICSPILLVAVITKELVLSKKIMLTFIFMTAMYGIMYNMMIAITMLFCFFAILIIEFKKMLE